MRTIVADLKIGHYNVRPKYTDRSDCATAADPRADGEYARAGDGLEFGGEVCGCKSGGKPPHSKLAGSQQAEIVRTRGAAVLCPYQKRKSARFRKRPQQSSRLGERGAAAKRWRGRVA